MKRRGRIIAVLLAVLFFASLSVAQENGLAELDAYINQALQDWQVPGLAIAIIKNDSLILAKGYGKREIGKDAEIDELTLFAVASNTKAFTATLLGMLVDSQQLDWDDRVTDYLSDFQMYEPYVTREINIRDLLTHRSGLPTFGGDHLWIGGSFSREEIVHRIRYLKPTASFRNKYQYQNLMYLVAGQVFTSIADQGWDEAIRERIFQPLGMQESATSIRVLQEKKNVAAPHEIVGGELRVIDYDDVDNVAPAAAIISNVLDMTKWMRLNMNDGVFAGKRLISSEALREIHSMQFATPISISREEMLGTQFSGYGLGWGISDYQGRKILSHGGGLSGMISRQTLVPDEKLGVIILTNFAPNSLPVALTYRILDTFLAAPQTDWSRKYLQQREQSRKKEAQEEEDLLANRHQGTQPSHPLEAYTGKYFDDLSGEAEVRQENGKLIFDYNPRHIGDLEHWHYDTFRLIWRHPIFDMSAKSFVTFYPDEAGEVSELKVTFYDPIVFKKIE